LKPVYTSLVFKENRRIYIFKRIFVEQNEYAVKVALLVKEV
jgi:hypothetical protein